MSVAPINPRHLVANPDRYEYAPALYASAWMFLMAQRGCHVDPDRIAHPLHMVIPGLPGPDLRDRIRDHARAMGYALPTSPPPPGAA
ncbi:MAG: hypothetical protein ACWA5A_09395 [Marinibacterium sp.]